MEHGAFFYLATWLIALASAISLLFLVVRVPFLHVALERREVGRHTRAARAFRLGGFFLSVVFLIILLADSRLEWNPPFFALFIGTLAITIFSLADDLLFIPWPWHLAFQTLLALLIFSSGMRLDIALYLDGAWPFEIPAAIELLSVVVWVVLVMNAVNWSDGTDGLMPGVAVLSFATFFLLSLRPEVNQPAVGILSLTLFALALALLFFNWHPAKILAGTGGAYFFGFALAALALYAGMKVATLLLVLALPVFDSLFVIGRRLTIGRSPFRPDEEHLHHLLLARGWRSDEVALAYLCLTTLLALLALSLEPSGKTILFVMSGGFVFFFPLPCMPPCHVIKRLGYERSQKVFKAAPWVDRYRRHIGVDPRPGTANGRT